MSTQSSFHQRRSLRERLSDLQRLAEGISRREEKILSALQTDLRKPRLEAQGTELVPVLQEIQTCRRKLKLWMKPKRKRRCWRSLVHAGSRVEEVPHPFGRVLIISPWNYPVNLSLLPLIGAIAAGNAVVLKPSELSPASAKVLEELLHGCFPDGRVRVVLGGPSETEKLLQEKFDFIFFTGSPEKGRLVMKAASESLTPLILELGGKSPCLLDETVPLRESLRRILWGKFLNAGQTCVAPDYLLLPEGLLTSVVETAKEVVKEFFGENPKLSSDYARIVSLKHWERLKNLMADTEILVGGGSDEADLYIAPTLLRPSQSSHPLFEEEIFGPIFPVVPYRNLEEALEFMGQRPSPLACYLFTKNKSLQKLCIENYSFGGLCINDTIIHQAHPSLGFGGKGPSGMGRYHGEESFRSFSQWKSVEYRSFWRSIPFRFPPYRRKFTTKFLSRWL